MAALYRFITKNAKSSFHRPKNNNHPFVKLIHVGLEQFTGEALRVWSEDLLIRAIFKVLPIAYAQWLRDVLSNRKAKVQINGDSGRQLPLHKGLSQGSALWPPLFLL